MLIGVIEAVVSVIFSALFCQSLYESGVLNGVKNVIRGTIETIPLLGNVLLVFYDHPPLRLSLLVTFFSSFWKVELQ